MSDTSRDWDNVEAEVRRVVADFPEPIAPSTIRIAEDVLSALRGDFPVPEVIRGYWPTIRFCSHHAWEIEVHSDHVEVYRFRDQHTDIQHFDHTPGDPLSPGLLQALALPPTQAT